MDCRTQLASLAIEELDKGDYFMAIKILTTGIKIEPNNHELYFERSICHHKLGNFQSSLDDANSAIRLNSTDYNIHYQKGLALIGLNQFSEAVTSFKKAIELRAKQDDSKLSDIFKLLRDATNELNTARKRPGVNNSHNQARSLSAGPIQVSVDPSNNNVNPIQGSSTDPVDSTTDRPQIRGSSSGSSSTVHQKVELLNDGHQNLVAENNNIQSSSIAPMMNGTITRVTSSAIHLNNRQLAPQLNISSNISNVNMQPILIQPPHSHPHQLHLQRPQQPSNYPSYIDMGLSNHEGISKSAHYEWNIRRSERIFLHNTNETPSLSGNNQTTVAAKQDDIPISGIVSQQPHSESNISQISPTKRPHQSEELHSYPMNKIIKSKDGNCSQIESDITIDVDDSYSKNQNYIATNNLEAQTNGNKRVIIAPSSSMPATNQSASSSTNKDDSYSSKYKRLRRDRERARRGTSKLCTIKPSDLEDLLKPPSTGTGKRSLRVIAPIDGWLYSGQLCIDDVKDDNGSVQYAVKLDGDTTGSNYLFNLKTVLNDVIKEVKVKSVSELRKGARICCYWSRQYKCLSTGVVTSRTFEATKSLVSVKYDNGDLSALPLEDLRLLPPDYPKYMSNCDPLLLARNEDGLNATIVSQDQLASRVIIETKLNDKIQSNPLHQPKEIVANNDIVDCDVEKEYTPPLEPVEKPIEVISDTNDDSRIKFISEEGDGINDDSSRDEDETIPPTDEIIDFITKDSDLHQPEDIQHGLVEDADQSPLTKDNINVTNETQVATNSSRASSEENNFTFEFSPWMFDGPPKRSKRHGRTYRDNYSSIRRGNEVIKVGDSAELMPRDESILPFVAKIDGMWLTGRGEMRVRVRWYYRLIETEGEPYDLTDGENALFETDHFDENDIQSIYRSTKILSWTEYRKNHVGHVNSNTGNTPKIFYLAGYYDPVRRIKHLRSDIKEAQ